MTEFAVCAPGANRVRLRLRGQPDREMVAAERGWWRLTVSDAGSGTDYSFLLDDADRPRSDPRSRWQPYGVHGPSRVYDHATFDWTDHGWTGRQLAGSIIYRLHVGTFTPDGTFDAAIDRLDHLLNLGVDLIELFPVNAFAQPSDGGYDGVCSYAPNEAYGGPDALKRLVNAAHVRGLGVILDVSHHQVGHAEAYPPVIGPYLDNGATSWGRPAALEAVHADEAHRYLVDGVLMWLGDYHADGLRIGAAPAIADHRASALLDGLATEVDALGSHVGRPLWLVAESDVEDLPAIVPWPLGGTGPYAPRTGDGLATSPSPGLLRIGAALLLTAPAVPVIFMGEEWGAGLPRWRGASHAGPASAPALGNGRRREVGAVQGWPGRDLPDPRGPTTVGRPQLDWAELDKPEHRGMLDFYRRLIALRKSRPDLADPRPDRLDVRHGNQFVVVRRGRCSIAANLAGKPQRITLPEVVRAVLLATRDGVTVRRDWVELPAESAVVVVG